jgi:hypothetical protein
MLAAAEVVEAVAAAHGHHLDNFRAVVGAEHGIGPVVGAAGEIQRGHAGLVVVVVLRRALRIPRGESHQEVARGLAVGLVFRQPVREGERGCVVEHGDGPQAVAPPHVAPFAALALHARRIERRFGGVGRFGEQLVRLGEQAIVHVAQRSFREFAIARDVRRAEKEFRMPGGQSLEELVNGGLREGHGVRPDGERSGLTPIRRHAVGVDSAIPPEVAAGGQGNGRAVRGPRDARRAVGHLREIAVARNFEFVRSGAVGRPPREPRRIHGRVLPVTGTESPLAGSRRAFVERQSGGGQGNEQAQ